MPEELKKETQPNIELDAEKISFTTPNGEIYKVQLQVILEKGDTTNALAFANLILLRNLVEHQSALAAATNELAEAFRSMIGSMGTSDEIADKMMDKANAMLQAAGINVPSRG